ncbi:MAG TPA: glycosyltransferase family 2 protein [Puia sp.]|nr:glycosyltransferase family 2 protein [Puia sp.]
MLFAKILFFTGIFIILYSYAGYGLLVWALIKARNLLKGRPVKKYSADLPPVTLIIAAYNEESFIEEKIQNTLSLDYPSDKLDIIFITDGSTDNTPLIAGRYKQIRVLHQPERKGKIAAMHRAMGTVKTPIVIFCDANTLLNKECISMIVRHYNDPKVGGVAGEKKILSTAGGKITGAGEGLYWKYESMLKKLDADFYTVVGAAGELFSIRTSLYEPVDDNVLLDDFIISLKICRKGYRIEYEPGAYASENPTTSMMEEKKRKIRISAGAFQSMVMLKDLLNIFKYPLLSFQYLSHRVLRWTLCPVFLPIIFILNIVLAVRENAPLYRVILAGQIIFYMAAIIGWILSEKKIKVKLLYIPYYFFFQNVSLYLGFIRYRKGQQSVLWEKAGRQQ